MSLKSCPNQTAWILRVVSTRRAAPNPLSFGVELIGKLTTYFSHLWRMMSTRLDINPVPSRRNF